MSAPVLEIKHARRSFRDRQALQDISLSVSAGEIVALLGPNGAGKTTLMRAVAGRLKLDAGSIAVNGKNPLTDSKARAALGIVPQTIALYPQLSCRQNLDVFARLAGLKGAAIKAAVTEALRRAGLQERADERLSVLSGGMQRRLNIVAGALHEPKLLLLDEPTVGVDVQARQTIHRLLRELRDAGLAILFSTHDFDQADSVADRAAFMAEGRLLLEGSVSSLVATAFGQAKEGVIEFVDPVSEPGAHILTEYKFRPVHDRSLWSGPLTGGYTELGELETKLLAGGAHIAEMRVREPGLGGVFRQLMNGQGA